MPLEVYLIGSLYVGWLVVSGLKKRPGMNSWHMFANLNAVQFEIVDQNGKEIAPWSYLPHTHLSMTLEEACFFLQYLRIIHRIEANGELIALRGLDRQTLKVGGGRVLDL